MILINKVHVVRYAVKVIWIFNVANWRNEKCWSDLTENSPQDNSNYEEFDYLYFPRYPR